MSVYDNFSAGGFSSLTAGPGGFGASNFGSSLSIPQPQSGGSQWQMRK